MDNRYTGTSGVIFTAGGTATANLGTTTLGGASLSSPQSNVTEPDPDIIRKLKLDITHLKNELTLERNENTILLSKINDLQHKITEQNNISIDVFSDKELKIILSKVHPDKNQNKASFNELTKKINLWRSK